MKSPRTSRTRPTPEIDCRVPTPTVKTKDVVKKRTRVGRSGCSVGYGVKRGLAKRRHDDYCSSLVRGYAQAGCLVFGLKLLGNVVKSSGVIGPRYTAGNRSALSMYVRLW